MQDDGDRLDQLAARLDGTSEVEGNSTKIHATPTLLRQTPHLWSDRPLDEPTDYSQILWWPDDEDANGQSLVEVSVSMATLLAASYDWGTQRDYH